MAARRGKGKRAARGANCAAGAISPANGVDLRTPRQKIGKYVSGKALAAIRTAAAGPERGDLSAMKYLFETIGLYPAAPETEGSPGDEQSLAKTLRDGCN